MFVAYRRRFGGKSGWMLFKAGRTADSTAARAVGKSVPTLINDLRKWIKGAP